MRHNLTQFAAGSTAVITTLVAAHFLIGNTPAKAESFDTRWTVVAPVVKSDRLATPSQQTPTKNSSVVFYNDPQVAVTIATKISVARNETKDESSSKARSAPIENARGERIKNDERAKDERAKNEKKLPVGCEPSFSPVTMPSMANVTGRCLSALEPSVKVADLSR